MKPLSQAEVDALPEGAEVWVTWSGGNGPHRYLLARRYGWSYAEIEGTDIRHELHRCGEHPLTQVWTSDPSAPHQSGTGMEEKNR